MAQLNTKIVLRNDSTVAWENAESEAKTAGKEGLFLLKGEIGIEFLADGTPKMKIGDGTSTWSELGYVGGAQANVFEVIPTEGQSHNEAIAAAAAGKTLNAGDIAYVKETIYVDETDAANNKYSYTGYVYNGTNWAAMDGNYSADNIYFDDDMLVTTDVGYIKTTNGSGTIPSAGKNLTQVFEAMFVKESQPTVTQPSVSLTASNNKAYEVGESVTPTYEASLNVGSYSYGPQTGVTERATDDTATGWKVTATGVTSAKTEKKGSFDTIVVDDETNYTITAQVSHTGGATPLTNKGNVATVAAIAEGTKSKTSSAITGYRQFFYGKVTKDPSELTSADIRSLTAGGNYNGSKSITIKADGATDVKAFVIAIPSTNTRSGVTKVDSTAGMTVDVTGQYSLSTTIKPQVADKRGTNDDGTLNNPLEYKLWIWQPASVDSGAVHAITLG